MYTHSTEPDVASFFRPIDHKFPGHDDDKLMFPKHDLLLLVEVFLHRFPLLGTKQGERGAAP